MILGTCTLVHYEQTITERLATSVNGGCCEYVYGYSGMLVHCYTISKHSGNEVRMAQALRCGEAAVEVARALHLDSRVEPAICCPPRHRHAFRAIVT